MAALTEDEAKAALDLAAVGEAELEATLGAGPSGTS